MINTILSALTVRDIRRKVGFTALMLGLYRLGAHLYVPGVNVAAVKANSALSGSGIFSFLNLFSGGALGQLAIFALGIMPYITASIILQLLQVVVPSLEKLQKEGELGRRKITQWTRYLTIILAVVQSFGIALTLEKSGGGFVLNPGIGFIAMTIITLTAGTTFIMWLGEQITERGIGNGMSLLIFTGIVVGLPRAIDNIYDHVFRV